MVGGCSGNDEAPQRSATQPVAREPTAQPAGAPAPKAEPRPLLAGFEAWTREEALARLASEATRLSAAVRLVQPAGKEPLCVPDPLSAEAAHRLRVLPLSETTWALGLVTSAEDRLRSPVLIDSDGTVRLPFDGVDEEVALLYVAKNTDIFPHVLITVDRVWLIDDEPTLALATKSPVGLRFDVRQADGYPYVALLWRDLDAVAREEGQAANHQPVEVARYKYDPYELAFVGPLSDKLPDPPGGLFELDLERSAALIPVGGEIPEPPPAEDPEFEPLEGQAPPY